VGLPPGVHVVPGARDGFGDRQQVPGQCGGDLQVKPVSRCLPENIEVPSLAQSQVGTRVPSIRTTRPADASAGSGTWPARTFSTTGSNAVHRLETVA
jgi:hypothetical protein